ncbi:nitric oxide reductase activation protein NorD [Mycobacterium sp. RTGN5]|uniref:nitric oxide reductase activation protein NorD n=1 Tax=Mycobacterium sp. RTGN5 TaxID=3016522 RepID=UPI0029C67E92|nr:VWA domain-containing protein [Mycobacterium sp. RTGN5]
MTDPGRFRLLASHIAGRAVDVTAAPTRELAYTDGRAIFVSADSHDDEQRREVVLQSALLACDSLDRSVMMVLRARPRPARRYLALEGRRALAELAKRVPLAASYSVGDPESSSRAESLDIAKSRRMLPAPPDWFGQLRPWSVLGAVSEQAKSPTGTKDLRLSFDPSDADEVDEIEDDTGPTERSLILKLFEAPAFSSRALSEYIRKLLGSSRSYGDDSAGAELDLGALRRGRGTSAGARPLPTRIHFTDAGRPGAAVGVGGALYPEWNVHTGRYRPEWSRVIDFPLPIDTDVNPLIVRKDDVLRRRLARIGLGFTVFRARPDGEDLDTEALVNLFVDLRSGYSPPADVYLERRKTARDLAVLILLDTSGSTTDVDRDGMAVHEHQRHAAATMTATLTELGDRVALYGFRSNGRQAVHLPAIKTFDEGFGVRQRTRLAKLQPSGYTRLGAAVRGAGEILKRQGGTPNRLLVVLSDGYAYDDGYEGTYAEADAAKALEELRSDGVACLCLAVGADTDAAALGRVFGPASHAGAATLRELSPRMDELFISALRELSVST